MSRIVALAGEGEYESDRTMLPIARAIAADTGATLDYRVPDVLEDYPAFPESSFGDLSVLDGADLLLLYTRFRVLPDAQMAALAAYVERGGRQPIVAVGPTTAERALGLGLEVAAVAEFPTPAGIVAAVQRARRR